MKAEQDIADKIKALESDYAHVLTGTVATIHENAPRALMQLDAESKLTTLHWVLGSKYKSKLKPSKHS